MELLDLEQGLKACASAGRVLNCQDFTGVQAGLTVLKSREKYDLIFFWGKILGQKSDYYLAYGLRDSEFEFPSKCFFYAGEDFEFHALPQITEEEADKIIELGADRPFTGVTTEPLQLAAAAGELEGEEGAPADGDAQKGGKVLTELERLTQVVQEIDFDTAAVPKGSYALNEAHVVVPSSDFKGLGLSQAASLDSYVHFRPPISVACLRAMAHTDAQFYANFLDQLKDDLPKGCWAVRQDPSVSLVTLRSLNWPGYVAYHTPCTTKFGGVYFGYAQKCRDLAFIL